MSLPEDGYLYVTTNQVFESADNAQREGDREGNIITPSRKVDEDAIRPGNGNAGQHRTIKGDDCLEAASRRIVWECL
jgi:hypothetical protein